MVVLSWAGGKMVPCGCKSVAFCGKKSASEGETMLMISNS
jgi:hypothetical protein